MIWPLLSQPPVPKSGCHDISGRDTLGADIKRCCSSTSHCGQISSDLLQGTGQVRASWGEGGGPDRSVV